MADSIFVSYSSADLPWAERIVQELSRRGHSVFFDRASLRAGQAWEQQVLGALNASSALVVLWSESASRSDWVIRERSYFDALIHDIGASNVRKERVRRLIPVLLDDTPLAFTSLQLVPHIRDAGSYAAGPDAFRQSGWDALIGRVEEAVNDWEYVSLAVGAITITRDRLAKVSFTPNFSDQMDLDTLLNHLGITRDQLHEYYSTTRRKWRPFGPANPTIEDILEAVRSDLNRQSRSQRFRWHWVDDDLWSEKTATRDAAGSRLATEHSVIVIDPLALYEPVVAALLNNYLDSWLNNERAIVMVLSIYPTWERQRYLRGMISQINRNIVNRYYDEPPRTVPYATCSVFTGDELDIKRLLRANLRIQTGIGRARQRNPYLAPGRR